MLGLRVHTVTCALLVSWCLFHGVRPAHHELRRELAAVKGVVDSIERKLHSVAAINMDEKFQSIESTLSTLTSKVSEIGRKSLLLSEIHQDNDVKKDLLQRIFRSVEDIVRRQSTAPVKRNGGELERLDKISENIQALFQIFAGMNRKIDDVQARIERVSSCPTNDLKIFIAKKMDSLSSLTECFECDKEPLKDLIQRQLRHSLENLSRKIPNDLEKNIAKILESKWKTLVDALQSDIAFKLESFGHRLDECTNSGGNVLKRNPKFINHDVEYSHDTPQHLKSSGRGDDAPHQRETPGRIFRKLWRKMTEPINKVSEKIEALSQSMESSNERHHNATLAKLRDLVGKSKGGEPCSKQTHELYNTTKDTALRLGFIESRQLTVQNLCSKILVEVERVKGALKVGSVSYLPGITEAYHEITGQGYLVGTSCADLQTQGTIKNGLYTIKPAAAMEAFLVFCDFETEGGGWTILQRRGDYGGEFQQNFTQNWEMYKKGFGDPQREVWIGNENIHMLSSQEPVKLRVELEDFDDNFAFAEYSRFLVDDESQHFRLSVGEYRGNATDSLSLHDGKMFSTQDRDNDEVASCCNCADTFKGGWWYYRCFEANLNGPYHSIPTENGYFMGIIWERWRGDYSLKSSQMKIRPLSFEEPQDP